MPLFNIEMLWHNSIMARKRFFPDDFIDKFICGDCLSIMREMPDECLDLRQIKKGQVRNGKKLCV